MSEASDTMDRPDPAARPRGGRPTKAAAAERDERLLAIAATMFMEQGFDATSMDGLAEAAAIGKATLYARYPDKGALFADVLRRRILQVFEPIEDEFKAPRAGEGLDDVLRRIAGRLVGKSLMPESVALGRILAAQGPRFPDLARLAVDEGYGRQLRLVATVLARFADDPRYAIEDPPMLADLFIAVVLGRATRLALLGVDVDRQSIEKRTAAAVSLFVRGVHREGSGQPEAM